MLLKVKWIEKGEAVLTRTTISPPPPQSSMPLGISRVQAFDHIHILIILAVKNGHLNKNSFLPVRWEYVQGRERGGLWWGGEGACDVGRGAAST